ncbi:MAG: ABC transporter substrate-binding protein [Jatrophihabitans sp.]|uniref:ABC transporter substrate-binding protein n=1 Tax=Jatrophihabitans sp. TaxID=1932789 RepID=UPI00391609BC
MRGGYLRVSGAAALSAVTVLALSGCLAGKAKTAGGLGVNKNTRPTIRIMVAFGGAQLRAFASGIEPYAKSRGITIKWADDSNFNADIVTKVKAGNAPDIALFPQPGILVQLAQQGKLADLNKVLPVGRIRSQLVAGLLEPSTYRSDVYGVPASLNLKSVVFYPKKAWARAGYPIPTSLAALAALDVRMKADGRTPWCLGVEDGSATGWSATDWIEQLLLDQSGTGVYNDWVSHKVKFDSAPVRQAAQYFHTLFATPGFIHNGRRSITSSYFGTAGNAMFDDKLTESNPGCYMYRQGNFITGDGFFPKKIIQDLDANVGVFRFPGKSAGDNPVEGGGDVAGLFSGHNKYAIDLLKHMLTPTFCSVCPRTFAYMSPFTGFALSNYPDQVARDMAKIAYGATSFVFDASDSMPGAVGSGTFWRHMTAWIGGHESLDTALRAIDDSWPRS